MNNRDMENIDRFLPSTMKKPYELLLSFPAIRMLTVVEAYQKADKERAHADHMESSCMTGMLHATENPSIQRETARHSLQEITGKKNIPEALWDAVNRAFDIKE